MKKNLFLIRHRLEAITLIPLLKLQKVSVNLYQSNDRRMNLVVGEDGRGKSQNKLQLLIDEFQPDRIINFGIAGSLSKDLPLGSLVQGDGIHHFSDENSNILPVTYCVIPQSIAPVYPLLTLKKTDPTLCRNELPQPVVLLDMEGAYYAKCASEIPFISLKVISDYNSELEKLTLKYIKKLLVAATPKLQHVLETVLLGN